jgi:signal peptidase I
LPLPSDDDPSDPPAADTVTGAGVGPGGADALAGGDAAPTPGDALPQTSGANLTTDVADPLRPAASQTVADGPDASTAVETPPPRRSRRWILEWAAVLLVAVGVAWGVRAFVVQTFVIPSGSMIPTLQIGDRIVVDKLSYRFHPVHRGDIIVFATPPGENDAGIHDLVKRVIGLPGESIASGPHGEVLINGRPIDQPWLTAGARRNPGPAISPQHLAKNEYFVMGDNRGDSEDSRAFGPISGSLIVGHAVFRFWPPSRIGRL